MFFGGSAPEHKKRRESCTDSRLSYHKCVNFYCTHFIIVELPCILQNSAKLGIV